MTNKETCGEKISMNYSVNFNPSYIGERGDILNLIPDNVRKVLDVGCSIGTLGEQIKRRSTAEVTGIELNENMAKIAEKKLNNVIIMDIEKANLEDLFSPNYFDCIIFADILEHLKDPWCTLKKSVEILSDRGVIIASIPNARHYDTVFNLLFRGYWPYRERGIHDKSHLRFFAFKNITEMFQNAGLNILRVKRNYRIIEKPHRFNRFSKYLALFPFRDLFVFQYLIVAAKNLKKGK